MKLFLATLASWRFRIIFLIFYVWYVCHGFWPRFCVSPMDISLEIAPVGPIIDP